MFSLKNVKFKHILSIDEMFIPRDKITCIVGESGSGKSTLLRLLNNMISPDSGEITYNGVPINVMDPVELRRRVVMLHQEAALFDGSVKDNLVIGLEFSRKPVPEDEKLEKVLKMVRLDKQLEESPEKFSGGEKQRLALARVLLMEPEVFLMDEPSSALDESTEAIVIGNLAEYTIKSNRTLVMVTHSKEVANAYGENIIDLHRVNRGGVEIG